MVLGLFTQVSELTDPERSCLDMTPDFFLVVAKGSKGYLMLMEWYNDQL